MRALEQDENPTQPILGPADAQRLRDHGPRYTETPQDPYARNAPVIAEPWNAVTAALFILIVLFWAWRLRGRYRNYPFLTACMPILLAGGIGGTLYHATRLSVVFFLLDVVPISLLGLAGSIYMAVRYWGRRSVWYIPALGAFYVLIQLLLFQTVLPNHLRINLSYASLAVVVLAPIVLVLIRTHFRHAGWVAAAFISFVIAWFFRLADQEIGSYLPMGSHWLWHTFGAASTALIIEYFYYVEGERTGARAAMQATAAR
jgi:hypothetical protein